MSTDTSVVAPAPLQKIKVSAATGFILVHALALGVFYLGFSWKGVILCLASYVIRMFAVTAGFHRYFSHRTYKLNRFWQLCMAVLAMTSAQKGVLWWASNHRHHHKYSDMPEDLHSPMQSGFFWSHIGWILSAERSDTDLSRIPDLAKFPELRWLEKNQYVPTMLYAVALSFAFGPVGLFYGYFLSTVLLWHGTFSINSVMHVFGRRVFDTTDDSRNSMIMALITLGEGWHNNHHFYPGSAAQGHLWWQIDVSYYGLWIGSKLGIVKDLREVPERLRQSATKASKGTKERFDAAVHSASDMLAERIEALSVRWASAKDSATVAANHAVAELEIKRQNTAAQLERLQAEYAAARKRLGDSAQKTLDDLRKEIEKAMRSLAEILESLVAVAESLGTPAMVPIPVR